MSCTVNERDGSDWRSGQVGWRCRYDDPEKVDLEELLPRSRGNRRLEYRQKYRRMPSLSDVGGDVVNDKQREEGKSCQTL